MIQEFVDRFMLRRESLRAVFARRHPERYKQIVEMVIATIAKDEYGEHTLDPSRIYEITNETTCTSDTLFVIAGDCFTSFWAVKIFYGTCAECDILAGIRDYDEDEDKPSEEQVKDYMTLALHIVQGLVAIGGEQITAQIL